MNNATWSELILEGHLAPEQAQQYHNVPFEIPAGISRIEVSYDYDTRIGSDPHLTGGNTLDIGIFDQRGADFPGKGFRGWTGSARHEFFIGWQEATPGYLAGPLEAGTWHITLGFYKSAPAGCNYRVTIRMQASESGAAQPEPLEMLTLDNSVSTLQRRESGWYRGELHCHSHNSDGDSAPHELVSKAVELGLDFLAITDHNSISHLAAQTHLLPGPLVLIPGCEVTTYKGHWNVWGLDGWIDFRTLTPELMAASIQQAAEKGFLTSCNHPRVAGPPWEFQEIRGQHCIEVWNGPWKLFNAQALDYWEARLRGGERLVAVGGSDAHFLHREHHASIGTPTSWVYCPESPTAAALLDAIRAGHVFISACPDGPRLYLCAGDAMMGDAVKMPDNGYLDFQLHILNGKGLRVEVHGASGRLEQRQILTNEQQLTLSIPTADTPYIRAQLVDPDADPLEIMALTNPIYLD